MWMGVIVLNKGRSRYLRLEGLRIPICIGHPILIEQVVRRLALAWE